MHIRFAEIGDEKAIASVIVSTWKEAYRGIVPQEFLESMTTEKHEQLFEKQIAEKTAVILVLETVEHEIVGMVSGGVDSSGKYDGEIVAIYVLQDYQKFGYGKRLFIEATQALEKAGHQSMIVWTFENNRDRAFYAKMGGCITEEQVYNIAGKELPLVGFVWNNIEEVCKHDG